MNIYKVDRSIQALHSNPADNDGIITAKGRDQRIM